MFGVIRSQALTLQHQQQRVSHFLRRYSHQKRVTKTTSFRQMSGQFPPEIEEAHKAALAQGKDTYIDPFTGYTVFTSLAAERRGKCCGRGCRHCPYGHFNVADPNARKAPLPSKPTLLVPPGSESFKGQYDHARVLFWSGGKDSFLAYLNMSKTRKDDIVLLTTFDGSSGIVPEQNISLHDVFDQARALKCNLVTIPAGRSNELYLKSVLDALLFIESKLKLSKEQVTLFFGDLHLQDIHDWRLQQYGALGYKCEFPLFKVPYTELNQELFGPLARSLGCRYFFSAVNSEAVGHKVGDELTQSVMSELMNAKSFDPYGENGEFHTVVKFSGN